MYKNCSECQKQFLYTTCSPQIWAWNIHVLNLQFNEQSVVILWVSSCKNKSIWQRFTCTNRYVTLFKNHANVDWLYYSNRKHRERDKPLLGAFFNYVIQILTTYLSQVDIGKQFLYFYIRENLNIIDMDFQY